MWRRISLDVPRFPPLGRGRPGMPPLIGTRAITSDPDRVSNTPQAAGADLVGRVLVDTGRIDGRGGRLDIRA